MYLVFSPSEAMNAAKEKRALPIRARIANHRREAKKKNEMLNTPAFLSC